MEIWTMIKILNLNKIVFLILFFVLFSFLIISCNSNKYPLEKKHVEYSDLVLLKKNRKFSTVAEALNLQNPLFDVMSTNGKEFEYKGVKYKRLKLFVKVGEFWNIYVESGITRNGNSYNNNTVTKNRELITYNVICDSNGLIVDWFTLLDAKNGNTDYEYELIKNHID